MKQGADTNFVCVTTYLPLTLHSFSEFLQHFIWVFTVCQNTSSGVSRTVKHIFGYFGDKNRNHQNMRL